MKYVNWQMECHDLPPQQHFITCKQSLEYNLNSQIKMTRQILMYQPGLIYFPTFIYLKRTSELAGRQTHCVSNKEKLLEIDDVMRGHTG
jgi:hypothetical protein